MTYRFRVGVKNLPQPWTFLGTFGYNHSCLLINKDLFEYGANSDNNKEKTYERHKDVGRDSSFNWDEVGGALNGTTHVSPDELEKAIKNDGHWAPGKYKLLSHNCHDFVKFCLDRLGCPESMIKKIGPCYKSQNRVVQIRSALDDFKNLDICGNNLSNGTEIILYFAHNGESQTFIREDYADGTCSFIRKGYAIDVKYGEVANETQIQIWERNGTDAQKFILKHENGNYYSIHSALNNNYVIDVRHGETENGTKIQLYEYNGTDAQKFRFIYDNMEDIA
jgi:hypothetical protein